MQDDVSRCVKKLNVMETYYISLLLLCWGTVIFAFLLILM